MRTVLSAQLCITDTWNSLFVFSLANPCETKDKGGCSQFCEKGDGLTYNCSCEDGYVLASNKTGCDKGELTTEISKLKKRRTTRRNTATRKLLGTIEDIFEKPPEEKIPVEVIALLETLEEEANKIKKLDEIFDMIESEEELEKESDDVVNISLKIKIGKEELRKCLLSFHEDTHNSNKLSQTK